MRAQTGVGRSAEAGFSLVELLCGLGLALVIASGSYEFLAAADRVSSRHAAQATSLADAMLVLDLVGAAARSAGYDSLGIDVIPVREALPDRVTFEADLNGDGLIQPSLAGDERVLFWFQQQSSGGRRVLRVIDLNGDGDGADEGEQQEEIAANLIAIDSDGDGSTDPFLGYDPALRPTLVRVTFGVRIRGSGSSSTDRVIPFHAAFRLRNGLSFPEVTCAATGS